MDAEQQKLLLKGSWYSFHQTFFASKEKFEPTHAISAIPETVLSSAIQEKAVDNVAIISQILQKRLPWKPKCLNLALVAQYLLRKQRIETTLHIGFRLGEVSGEIGGHAWLTIGDRVITGWLPDLALHKELFKKVNHH